MSILSQASLFEPEPRELPSTVGVAKVSAIQSTQLLTPGKGSVSSFDYTLNPYRGCSFGCSYCFAAFFVADDLQRADWGRWVEVKVRAAEALRHRDLRDKKIFMSSATDPYQPLEAKVELTRSLVEILAESQARLVVQTRSPLAARDADLFKRFQNLKVNMSITTDDDSIRRRFEPGCASIDRRLEAVARLKEAGIRVSVCVCPMLPMRDPGGFGRKLTRMGVDFVTSCYFHTGDRAFAAGTRDPARELIRELGWTYEAYSRCREALLRGSSVYDTTEAAFGPV